jgi:hypothetical protein
MEIFGFWQRQEIWSSDTYDQSLILVWIQKTRHAYKSQWKSQIKNCEWHLHKGCYDIIALFRFSNESWNSIYWSSPRGTQNFELPECECANHLQASQFFSIFCSACTKSSNSSNLAHQYKCSDVDLFNMNLCNYKCMYVFFPPSLPLGVASAHLSNWFLMMPSIATKFQ